MRNREGKALLWIVLMLVLVIVVSAGFALSARFTPQEYLGRVKLMLRPPDQQLGALSRRQTEELIALVRGEKVLQRSHETLRELGVTQDASEILETVNVELIPDTQILRVEVTARKYEDAKNAADVLATEALDVYQETTGGRNGHVIVADEAYASPVDKKNSDMRLALAVSALSLTFLAGIGIGTLLRQR